MVRKCVISVGQEVLLSNNPKQKSLTPSLAARHSGPYTVANLSSKGVATIVSSKGTRHKQNVARLRPYHRPEGKA